MEVGAPQTIKRVRKISCPEVENATFSWFAVMREQEQCFKVETGVTESVPR